MINKEELEDLNKLLENEIKDISYGLSPKRLFKIEHGKIENLSTQASPKKTQSYKNIKIKEFDSIQKALKRLRELM